MLKELNEDRFGSEQEQAGGGNLGHTRYLPCYLNQSL